MQREWTHIFLDAFLSPIDHGVVTCDGPGLTSPVVIGVSRRLSHNVSQRASYYQSSDQRKSDGRESGDSSEHVRDVLKTRAGVDRQRESKWIWSSPAGP